MPTQNIWWQVIIPSPEACTGKNVSGILSFVTNNTMLEDVACLGMEGFAEFCSLTHPRNRIPLLTTVSQLLNHLPEINQLCWADLFVCSDITAASSISEEESMPSSVGKSIMTVSTIDQSFFYIYTQDDNLISRLKHNYDVVEATKGNIFDFGFPF